MPIFKRFRGSRVKTASMALAATLGMAASSMAAQFDSNAAPVGTSDIRAAELPPEPGLYLGFGGVFANIFSVNDANGDPIFPETGGSINAGFLGGLYVYPFEVFGGRVASSVGASYVDHRVHASNDFVSLESDNQGISDVYSDLFVWSKTFYDPPEKGQAPSGGIPPLPSGFAVALGLGVTVPVGRYDYDEVGNAGFDSWIISPNVAFTYRTKPLLLDGTEFSTRIFYNAVLEREDEGRRYDDGDYFSIDWAVTERWNRFQFGPTGNFAVQVEDDEANSPVINGRHTDSTKVGALLQVDIPEYKTGIQFKYLRDVSAKNNLEGELYTVKMLWKIF